MARRSSLLTDPALGAATCGAWPQSTLVASETLSEDEIADAGIADITRALGVLGQISAEGMRLRGLRAGRPDLPAHTTVATIAGMVALRSTFFGANQPSREAIVDELVQAILHGFLHRCD